MCSVVDVAAYILDTYGPMTTMKLQKLAFYSQAHHLASHGRCLFMDDFEAWVNGPVAPSLYSKHRGKFLLHAGELSKGCVRPAPLEQRVKDEIDYVCGRLAKLSGNQLSELSHREDPWADARKGLSPSQHCSRVISKESIRKFYSRNPTWELV